MKKVFQKTLAFTLCVSMLTSAGTATAFAAEASSFDPSDNSYYRGAFYYRPGEGEIIALSDSVDYYTYSDDYFKNNGKMFNGHLATLSMSLAEASVSSTREDFTPEGYARKSRNVTAFLEDIGFSDITINRDYTLKPTKKSVGVACAHKKITLGEKTYTLLAVVPRSAGYEAEWGNNFVLGAEGDAKGFDGCADTCLAFAKSYIADKQLTGDIKLWTVGYSRGAAIVDLMAKKLIDAPQAFLGDTVRLSADDLYTYTFGTPSGADSSNQPRDEKYAGIFNSFEDTELASSMAPPDMGFSRYGTDRLIGDDRTEDMLQNLAVCNPKIYEEFVTTSGSYLYSPKMLGFVNGSVGILDDEHSYIPTDVREYLRGLGTYLTQVTGGRKSYTQTYEQPFSDFLAYYQGLTGENNSAFGSALIGSEESVYLLVAMYAYFMKLKSETVAVNNTQQITEKARELAAVSAAADDSATGIDALQVAKIAARLSLYLTMDAKEIKKVAAQYLGTVLTNAMTVSGATRAQIAALCNNKSLDALTHLISHLLLGNIWQSDAVNPLLLNNEQMKNAATLIGNFANLMYDHANEVIMSWLRLDDSYFTDYTALTDEQTAGYRRVYLKTDSLNAVITDSTGGTVATINDGVLDNSADKWIGFTSTDDGGFFRFPNGETYTVVFRDVTDTLDVTVDAYHCYTATAETVFQQTETTEKPTAAVLTLPAESDQYELILDESGQTCQLGDVNMDGIVSITDATLLQSALANLITLTEQQATLGDVNKDGSVTISDVTAIQIYIAEFKEGYYYTGEAVILY